MAGNGPAPKDPSARRRRTPPMRGEWVDLPKTSGRRRPALPKPAPKGGWPSASKDAWAAWWADPAASQWTPADELGVAMLLRVFTWALIEPKFAAEARLRADGLGLTPKGKRDLRWRVATDPAHEEGPSRDELSERRKRRDRVKAVDAVAGS